MYIISLNHHINMTKKLKNNILVIGNKCVGLKCRCDILSTSTDNRNVGDTSAEMLVPSLKKLIFIY